MTGKKGNVRAAIYKAAYSIDDHYLFPRGVGDGEDWRIAGDYLATPGYQGQYIAVVAIMWASSTATASVFLPRFV